MTDASRGCLTEWEAGTYHRVSTPQVNWGRTVLARLPLTGTETVVDAGCGTGRLTAELLERVPNGHVIAVDRSANMLAEAEAHLAPRFGDRVSFHLADVQDLSLPEPVDAIFSTATFHWVPDHPRLFRALYCLPEAGRAAGCAVRRWPEHRSIVSARRNAPGVAAVSRRGPGLVQSMAVRLC